MRRKKAIVTGANSGVGLETARGLASLGAHVTLACRDITRAEQARKDILATDPDASIDTMRLDLADLASVRWFTKEYQRRHTRLHALVNNAGVYAPKRRTTKDGFEETFGVNHLGHFLLTNLLLPTLKASAPARVITVSSVMHRHGRLRLDDLNRKTRRYHGVTAYADSKLANVLFANELARRVPAKQVTSNSLHPGTSNTQIYRDLPRWFSKAITTFMDDPHTIAQTIVALAQDPTWEGLSGRYFSKKHPAEPATRALDAEMGRRLWEQSAQMVGLA